VGSTACVAAGSSLCSGLGSLGSGIFSTGATAALDSLSTWVASGSVWFLDQVGSAMTATTSVDLAAPWFVARVTVIDGLLAAVALPFLLLSIVTAIVRQDLGGLVRVVVVQLPLAMVLAGGAAEFASLGLAATDQLARAVSAGAGGSVASLATSVSRSLDATAGGAAVPAFVGLLAAVVVATAGCLLWIELVIRAGAIYAAVAFLPLVLVAGLWPAAARWSRRLVETLAALITSKLVIVLVLALAAGALGTAKGRGLGTVMTGTGMLLLAGFAPFTLLKLLPHVEASAVGHLEGLRQRGTAAVVSGPPRRLAEAALLGAGGPAGVVAAAGSTMGSGPTTGHVRTEDPMATAARFKRGRDEEPPPSPIRTGPSTPVPRGPSGDGSSQPAPPRPSPAPAAARTWPGVPEAVDVDHTAPPAQPVPPRRAPTLRIISDEIGPRIVPAAPTDA
jgi:hypothetical protein